MMCDYDMMGMTKTRRRDIYYYIDFFTFINNLVFFSFFFFCWGVFPLAYYSLLPRVKNIVKYNTS